MAVPNGLQWLHVDLHRSPVKQLYQNADAALGGGGGCGFSRAAAWAICACTACTAWLGGSLVRPLTQPNP
jgi:hypothetical protein